ncbi:flippase [Candidatus Woesearchaeota archaeon]|nr:flippase [Candidatus Woesearchaeota archaeon]
MTNYTQRAVKGFFWVFLMTMLGAVIGYVYRMVLARNLTVEEYGLFYSLYAFMSLLFLFRGLGMGQALVTYISKYIANEKLSEAKIVFNYCVKIIGATSVVLATSALILSKYIAIHYLHSVELVFEVRLFSLLFLFQGIDQTMAQILTAFQKHFKYASFQFIRQILSLIIVIPLLKFGLKIQAPIFSYIITSLTLLVLYFSWFGKKLIPKIKRINKNKSITKQLWTFGLPTIFASLGGLLLQNIDTFMISILKTTSDVGIYNSAVPISSILIYVSTAVSTVMIPMTSELWAKKMYTHLKEGIEQIYKYLLLVTLPLVGIITILSKEIVILLFGKQYIAGGAVLKILIFAGLMGLLSTTNFNVLFAIGETKKIAQYTLFGGAINFLLNLLLIPALGLKGAAITTVIGYTLMFVLGFIHVKSKTKVTFNKGHFLVIFIGAITTAIGIIINSQFKINNLISGALFVLVLAIIYCSILITTKTVTVKEIKELKSKFIS